MNLAFYIEGMLRNVVIVNELLVSLLLKLHLILPIIGAFPVVLDATLLII